MKIAIIFALARQVEGEFFFFDVHKADVNPDRLWRYLRETDLPRTAKIGEIDCTVEYGVVENVEVENLKEAYGVFDKPQG